MIWVRYNTHTHTYTQHRDTPTHVHTRSHKQGQESLEYQSKKQKKAKRIIGIFQQELTWVFVKKNSVEEVLYHSTL